MCKHTDRSLAQSSFTFAWLGGSWDGAARILVEKWCKPFLWAGIGAVQLFTSFSHGL